MVGLGFGGLTVNPYDNLGRAHDITPDSVRVIQ